MFLVGESNSFEGRDLSKVMSLLLLGSAYTVEKHCDERRGLLIISYDDPLLGEY